MKDLINTLLESVKTQVKESLILEEISDKLEHKKYRQAFLIMNNLRESGKWVLSEDDEKNLEEFWWEYAN